MNNWWVCEMIGGGWFWCNAAPGQRPNTHEPLRTGEITIAANSYRVVYGPCTYAECEEYVRDIRDARPA